MGIYILIDSIIIVFGILLSKYKFSANGKPVTSKIYFAVVFLTLFVISAFRGELTQDYLGYIDIFNRFYNRSFRTILSYGLNSNPEIGFLIFQYIIKIVFDSPFWIFIISSFVIVYAHVSVISKEFPVFFLPLLAFVEIGGYYASYNVVRQFMAISIVLFGLKYLYSRELWKYFLVVAIASQFHVSVFAMIPMYFLYNIKLKRRGIFYLIVITCACFVLLPSLIIYIQNFFWDWYPEDYFLNSGYSFKNIVGPLIVSLPPIIFYNLHPLIENDEKTQKTNLWLNGTYFYLLLSILGMRIAIVSRLGSVFSIFAILAFAQSIKDIKSIRKRKLVIFFAILLICAYGYFVKSGSAYDPYFFIWQS